MNRGLYRLIDMETEKARFWRNLFVGPILLTMVTFSAWAIGLYQIASGLLIFTWFLWLILVFCTTVRRVEETLVFFAPLGMVFFSCGAVLYLGGILESGGVVFVGLLGGLTALKSPRIRQVKLIFGLYLLTIIGEAGLQPWLRPVVEIPPGINLLLFVVHILIVFAFVFALLRNHIDYLRRNRMKSTPIKTRTDQITNKPYSLSISRDSEYQNNSKLSK